MKSSPFDTFADFSGATGTIHTFSGSPMVIYVSVALCAAICLLLIVKSYMTKH